MASTAQLWSDLVAEMKVLARLEEVRGALTWDQQTYLPPDGNTSRGEQVALLMRLSHERMQQPWVGEHLEALAARDDLDDIQRAGVRNLRRDWDRAARVPAELIERMGRLQGEGFVAWMKAREAKDPAVFLPVLRELVQVVGDRARVIDPSRPVYDVLLDEFDPGTDTASLVATFGRLRAGLVELIDAVKAVEPMPRLEGRFDPAAQLELSRRIAVALGYDLKAGRIDVAEHPFTVSLGQGDIRITTRVGADDLLAGIGGTTHEAGHGMYEQGLPRASWLGTGVDRAASMGLHESQSRFWENAIGRSLPFFRWIQGPMREVLGADAPSADRLFRAANRVEPGAIRIAADEVTYNLHIIVRFELERRLFDGSLDVADLPGAWNESYRQDLGVDPEDHSKGVLQDVHWSGGAFGYFPSYTLGNLYAASLARKLGEDLPDLWSRVEAGDFAPILGWLRDRIHRHGHLHDAPELVRRVVGDRDHVEDLLAHLWGRHGALHGLARPSET